MAPNVKEVFLALESLDLSQHVVAKYAPLTAETHEAPSPLPRSSEQDAACASFAAHESSSASADVDNNEAEQPTTTQEEEVFSTAPPAVVDSDDYWTMPTEAAEEPTAEESRRQELVDAILEEERLRQLLSADRLVANLTRDAAAATANAAAAAKTQKIRETAEESASYWDMPSDVDEEMASFVVKEEETEVEVPACLTTDGIVSNLIADGRLQDDKKEQAQEGDPNLIAAPHVDDPTHPLHTYWDWDTSPQATSYEAKRLALVRQLLEEEAARKLLSSDHLVDRLVRSMSRKATAAADATSSIPRAKTNESHRYWSWPTATATATATASSSSHVHDDRTVPAHDAYWTWDAAPKTTNEQRRIVIDWIVRDEMARQVTCTDAVVARLLQAVESSVGKDGDAATPVPVPVAEESKESGEGYWDW